MMKVTKSQAVIGSTSVIAIIAIVLILVTTQTKNENLRSKAPVQSLACSVEQLETFACSLPEGVTGTTVCRSGFSACVRPEEHRDTDTCGSCFVKTPPPIAEVVVEEEVVEEEPEATVIVADALVEPPLCSDVELMEYECPLADDTQGALVCHMGFTACRSLEDIKDTTKCGCCPGDKSPRCQGK